MERMKRQCAASWQSRRRSTLRPFPTHASAWLCASAAAAAAAAAVELQIDRAPLRAAARAQRGRAAKRALRSDRNRSWQACECRLLQHAL